MSEVPEPIDVTQFFEAVDMDTATSSVIEAGGSLEASEAVRDLVESGAFHMGAEAIDGGYAIYRLVPILVRNGQASVEPIEFGANLVAPQMTEWARSTEPALLAPNSGNSGRFRKAIGRTALSTTLRLSPKVGGSSLPEICDVAEDLNSHMIGGLISGAIIQPIEDGLIRWQGLLFWHRSIPLALPESLPDDATEVLPFKKLRKKSEEINSMFSDPEFRATLALVHLYEKASHTDTVHTSAQINLKLPPKRFLS